MKRLANTMTTIQKARSTWSALLPRMSRLSTSPARYPFILAILLLCVPSLASAQTYTTSPPPFLLAQNNSGAIINNACVWTYVAGTTTAATTYSDGAGTPNSNPIRSDSAGRFTAFLVPGNSYKFVYETACVPPAHGSTLKTADNISAMPPSGVNVDITGTAGESINASAVVYVSDGSAGNTAGRWYNASSNNTYSSTTATIVGFATAAVTSGSTGSFRISGQVTGLSSLSTGSSYYIAASAGTVTATAPGAARLVGVADSATTLVVAPNPKVTTTSPLAMAEGRLTATTAVPVTTADVSAATSIFYTPYIGNRIALYDGSASWNVRTFTEITISLSGCTASKPYDVFLFDSSGTVTEEHLVWTNDTTRATALVMQDGVLVKTGATTRRYVGTFFCNASGGQTDDTFVKRYIFNANNRKLRALRRLETTASWTYNSSTLRQANAAPANQVEIMAGLSEDAVDVNVIAAAGAGTANDFPYVSIGLDSTTTSATGVRFVGDREETVTNQKTRVASLITYPGVGRHTLVWLEARSGAGTATFTSGDSVTQAGIAGVFPQ